MGRMIVVLGIALLAADAYAASGHSHAKATLVRGGKKWKLTLRLNNRGHGKVLVGIIPRDFANSNISRLQAHKMSEGILLHQFDEIELKDNEPFEMEWLVEFNEKLKPGAKLSVISAWFPGSPHVFGGRTTTADENSWITLPDPDPAEEK